MLFLLNHRSLLNYQLGSFLGEATVAIKIVEPIYELHSLTEIATQYVAVRMLGRADRVEELEIPVNLQRDIRNLL